MAEKLKPQPLKELDKLKPDPKRIVRLYGPIGMNAERIAEDLERIDATPGVVTLAINSPGGSVEAGLYIIRAMEKMKNPLQCVVEANAFSMAAIISAYCPTLYTYKFSQIMFHEASYGTDGNESKHLAREKMTQTFLNQVYQDLSKKLGITPRGYKQILKDSPFGEWWISAKDAVRMGMATAVVNKLDYPLKNYEDLEVDSLRYGTIGPALRDFFSRLLGLRSRETCGFGHDRLQLSAPAHAPMCPL